MAAISGTNVAAKIVPFTTDDKFATHVSTYGQGGWHEVATDTERDAIPTDRRIAGMAVYVTGTKKLYVLGTNLTTWTELESGKVDDVQVNGTSVVTNKVANITVPSVIDNLTSTSTTDALSANQGKVLQGEIESLQGLGRFLSTWNCATGLAGTNPPTSPYTYHSGDYFIVGNVSAADPAVNYKPNGSSYTTGTASTTVETEAVAINDVYIYDGTNWKLQINSQRDVTFSSIAGNPTDNTNLAAALNAKQDVIQVSAIPAASADNLGRIVQWIGTTGTYANGYFYQCTLITIPSSATVTANEGSDITDLEIDLETFESYVEPTGNMTLVFTYDGNEAEWLDAEQNIIDLADYGISYSETPSNGDTITVVYTAESNTYGWVEKLVQHGITITYNAETEELTIS